MRCKHFPYFFWAGRSSNEIALSKIAARFPKEGETASILHSFCNNSQTKTMRKVDGRLHKKRIVYVLVGVLNKAPVDL